MYRIKASKTVTSVGQFSQGDAAKIKQQVIDDYDLEKNGYSNVSINTIKLGKTDNAFTFQPDSMIISLTIELTNQLDKSDFKDIAGDICKDLKRLGWHCIVSL